MRPARLSALLVAFMLVACAAAPPAPAPLAAPAPSGPDAPRGQRLSFSFETLQGEPLSTDRLAGRLSVIGFAATYDAASQAEAQFLGAIARKHVPRVNVALLVLEPLDNRPMIEAFVSTFRLGYPVAIADEPTIAGRGAFGALHSVPSVIVLDAEGREAWRHIGLAEEATIVEALRAIERGETPASVIR